MELVSDLDPAVAVIVVTGHASLDSAIDAVRKGASDYLTKPVDIERLWNLLDSFGQRRGRTAV
jgi:DNA-binding NtrC family response regulator